MFKKSYLILVALILQGAMVYGAAAECGQADSAKPTKNTVYIYAGTGADPGAIEHTTHTLRSILDPKYSIKKIEPADVIEGIWTKNAALFVLPGGAATPYHKALSPGGNAIINKYVWDGGAFLGICAGAYYSGTDVEFAKGTPIEICAKRDLGFYPDCVEGPTLKAYTGSSTGACAAPIRMADGSGSLKVYYNGGGHFVNADKHPAVKILSYYEDSPEKAAIVHIPHGEGNVILSGVHWEFAPALFRAVPAYLDILHAHEEARLKLVNHILTTLGLATRTYAGTAVPMGL